MVRSFREDPKAATPKYYCKSNSETTISAKKRKFGSFVRVKDETSQKNEETLA